MRVRTKSIGTRQQWEQVVEHRNDILLEDFEIFEDYYVLAERFQGLTQFRIISRNTGNERLIDFGESTYSAKIHSNPNPHSTVLRYSYSSLTTPESIYEFDLSNGRSSCEDDRMVTISILELSLGAIFKARDGAEALISLVYRKDSFSPGLTRLHIRLRGLRLPN